MRLFANTGLRCQGQEDNGETVPGMWDFPRCFSISPHRPGTYKAKRLPFTALPPNHTANGIPCHPKAAFVLTSGASLGMDQRRACPLQPRCQAGSQQSHRMGHNSFESPHPNICSYTLRTRQGLKPTALAGFGLQKVQMSRCRQDVLSTPSALLSPSSHHLLLLLLLEADLKRNHEGSSFLVS